MDKQMMNGQRVEEASHASDFDDLGMLDALFDTEMLMSLGAAAAGGGAAGLAYGVILDKVDWLSKGSGKVADPAKDNVILLKQVGLAAIVGVASGAALWQVSEAAAHGAMGAMGSVVAVQIANRVGLNARLGRQIVPELPKTETTTKPIKGLAATRIRQGLPAASFSGTRITPADPRLAALAGMGSTY